MVSSPISCFVSCLIAKLLENFLRWFLQFQWMWFDFSKHEIARLQLVPKLWKEIKIRKTMRLKLIQEKSYLGSLINDILWVSVNYSRVNMLYEDQDGKEFCTWDSLSPDAWRWSQDLEWCWDRLICTKLLNNIINLVRLNMWMIHYSKRRSSGWRITRCIATTIGPKCRTYALFNFLSWAKMATDSSYWGW